MRRLLPILLLLLPFVHGHAYAQAPSLINCGPSVACNHTTGPSGTGTGLQLWQAFGYVNDNLNFAAPLWALPVGGVPCNRGGSSNLLYVCTAAQFQAEQIAQNAQTCSDSPSAGPLVAYNPSCWGINIGELLITPTTGGTTICSLVAGSDKQDVIVKNASTTIPAFILNQCSSDSTAANRFSMEANFMIQPGGQARITYDSTSSRWNLL